MSISNQTTIRLSPDIKSEFAKTCADLGMSVSTAINLFAKAVVREQRIPFEVKTEKLDAATLAVLEQRKEDIKNGKCITFNTVKELKEYDKRHRNAQNNI
ncbi:MAG: type II toxin-antitoxin system RelB/DinJ family antitoxin [Ruminococcus sp.]|jgi:DNA-damage-inducible protein J|nr:type II toxin-antitoxin system RelB/DinJ family antitoxin [Ruminococcus sp.]